jgi:hypothetical protein
LVRIQPFSVSFSLIDFTPRNPIVFPKKKTTLPIRYKKLNMCGRIVYGRNNHRLVKTLLTKIRKNAHKLFKYSSLKWKNTLLGKISYYTRGFDLKGFESSEVPVFLRTPFFKSSFDKSFYQNTRVNFLSKQYTRGLAFCSTNAIYSYVTVWNSVWSTGSTYLLIPLIDFLAYDLKFYNYDRWRYRRLKTLLPKTTLKSRLNLYKRIDSKLKMNKALERLLKLYTLYTQRSLYKLQQRVYYWDPQTDLVIYKLFLTFKSTRLYVNLESFGGRKCNYFSLSPGLFLKYFNNKKAFKKHKLIKILLMKYARKLCIVSGVRDIEIFVNRTPVAFLELFNTFASPVVAPFKHPLTGHWYDDTELNSKQSVFHLQSVTFSTPKPYGYMKGPRRGRLKRKIMRRLIKANSISD